MAIAFGGSGTLSVPNGSTNTTSVTINSTANRYFFASCNKKITAISLNGVALSVINTYNANVTGNSNQAPDTVVWGLSNPSSGTVTLSATAVSDGTSNTYNISYAYYTGVDPTQPEAVNYSESGGIFQVTSLSSSVTTVTNNAWLAWFVNSSNSGFENLSAGASTTRRVFASSGYFELPATTIFDSGGAKSPAGNYTLAASWVNYSGTYSSVLYSLKPYLAVTLTGPSSGNVNAASTNFTVTPDTAINGSVTITPSGAGSAGLSPTVLNFSNSSSPQTFTITPLTSGAITLTVTNSVGLNNSAPITYTANAVAPSVPTIGIAVPLNTSATVGFTGNSDGGSAITQYRATSTPGSFTGTGLTSPITVSGLTNGVAYTFTVRATNAIGNSAESLASNSVTPYVPASSFTFTGPSSGNVRSASTNFTVTPNSTYNGTITLTPSGPGSIGLSPVVLTFNLSSAAQTFTITPTSSGLITLTPSNSNGISNPSSLNYTANAVVPLAPSIGLASPSLSSASVAFTAPSNDGGSTITMYTVTSSPGGLTATANQPGTVQVLGLTNGTSYTFSVTATNSVGTSASSAASNAVIPSASSTSFTNSGPKFNIDRGVGNLLKF